MWLFFWSNIYDLWLLCIICRLNENRQLQTESKGNMHTRFISLVNLWDYIDAAIHTYYIDLIILTERLSCLSIQVLSSISWSVVHSFPRTKTVKTELKYKPIVELVLSDNPWNVEQLFGYERWSLFTVSVWPLITKSQHIEICEWSSCGFIMSKYVNDVVLNKAIIMPGIIGPVSCPPSNWSPVHFSWWRNMVKVPFGGLFDSE